FSMCRGNALWCHLAAKSLAISTNGSNRSESSQSRTHPPGRSSVLGEIVGTFGTVARHGRRHQREKLGTHRDKFSEGHLHPGQGVRGRGHGRSLQVIERLITRNRGLSMVEVRTKMRRTTPSPAVQARGRGAQFL